MSIIKKLFSAKGEKKEKPAKEENKTAPEVKEGAKPKKEELQKSAAKSEILLSPHMAEKALSAQKLNQYVFKVNPKANKIMVAKEVAKIHNVKVAGVNMINVPKKARRVGKTQGFKAGYKKAIVTLTSGQTIEMK